MGERTDATWAAKRVGLSVPRQNGKTQLLVARALAGALLFGEKKIVVSAHQQDTAREAFDKLLELIEADGNEALRSRLDPTFGRGGVMYALNREAVRFTSGAKIQFKARSGVGSKGFSADCLLLDEAQILGARAWTSINSTMSAMPNPQVWLLGTPPQEEDDCFAFDMVRRAALAGTSTAAAWVEWSADKASPGYDPADEVTRWSANPAWNIRINHEVVEGEFETYTREKFEQDRLGVWREEVGATRLISADAWQAVRVTEPPEGGVNSIGIVFDFGTDLAAMVGASRHEDGVHVELIDVGEPDLDALADWLEERWRDLGMVAICGGGGSKALHQELRDRKVPANVARLLTTTEYFTANAMALDAITSGTLTVPAGEPTDALERSVRISDRKMGTAGWRWKSQDPGGQVPMEALSVALWAARINKRKPGRKQVIA